MQHSSNSEIDSLDTFKAMWSKYGSYLLLLIAIVLVSVLGVQQWQKWHYKRISQASVLYETLLNEEAASHQSVASAKLNVSAKARQAKRVKGVQGESAPSSQQIVEQLINDYSKTPYALLARLIRAAQLIDDNKLTEALAQLQAAKQQNNDVVLEQIIDLRMARVLFALNKTEEAKQALDEVSSPALRAMVDAINKNYS